MSDQVRHRRRGEELENALLDAAWEELATAGFASLTMESVAARAKTGVAVLYRRWPNKDDLVLAAIDHYRRTHPVETPDTGTLRGDLLALLGELQRRRSSFTTVIDRRLRRPAARQRHDPGRGARPDHRGPAAVESRRSTAAPTSGARSTSTASPRRSCRCPSTSCAMTC